MADVKFLGNGLRSIFTKVETAENLYGLLLLFWDRYEQTEYADATLSALFETTKRHLGVASTKTDWVEYKINFFSSDRLVFMGQDPKVTEQEESDIIAQVRWMKGDFEDDNIISQTSPRQLFNTLALMSGLGRTPTLEFLEDYAEAVYEKGARITHLLPHGPNGAFLLIMRYQNVSIKFHVYVQDYVSARYYYAHRT